jgi:hypothetical protein
MIPSDDLIVVAEGRPDNRRRGCESDRQRSAMPHCKKMKYDFSDKLFHLIAVW